MKYILSFLIVFAHLSCAAQKNTAKQEKISLGAEQMNEYLPLLKNKNVALVVNHTSTIGKTHLVDTLLARGVHIRTIFAPEHGFRGTAADGEEIKNGVDSKSHLPITSLYGDNKKPKKEQLEGIQVVIFDIQDVGTRFYTYISTLHYVMEACAENNVQVMVLDRPNPNGNIIDGPILDLKYRSFVGMNPTPVVHGCTVGELARMFNGEKWLKNGVQCDLKVIPCKNYTHQMPYVLPISPSPNLPNQQAVLLYPSLCLFEGTEVSVGRGTNTQFQVIGSPNAHYGDYTFTPKSMSSSINPPQKDKLCYGYDLRTIDAKALGFSLKYLLEFYQKAPDKSKFFIVSHFDRLAGSDQLRKLIESGKNEAGIRQTWQEDLDKYKTMRKKYLLYP